MIEFENKICYYSSKSIQFKEGVVEVLIGEKFILYLRERMDLIIILIYRTW